jgi:putative membrane protein
MKRALAVTLAGAFLPSTAYAHADGLPIAPSELWHHWTLDPWVWAPLLLAHWLYGRGVLRAWARAGPDRIIEHWRIGAFAAGEVVIVVALISPLDALGETLLSAHMAQHILLTTLAPLLLVLGAPALAWTWALPAHWRTLARTPVVRALVALWTILTRPFLAVLLHSLALWLWHTPALFDAALRDQGAHSLEHLSFFVTALIFWSAVFKRGTAHAIAAMLVLLIFVQCGILGAILALAPQQLYSYGDRPMLWGLSGLEDQQIAGLLMWAPAGLTYMAPFLWLSSRVFVDPSVRRVRDSAGIMRASTSSRSMK